MCRIARVCNLYTTSAEKEAPRQRHLLRKPWSNGIISAQRSSPPGWIARMCNHYTRNQCWFLSVSVKFLLLYGNISGFPWFLYITTNSHTLYIYIFHYYLIPAPDYTVIISFICAVFLRRLYGYHLFFLICTVFLPKLYGYYFFSFICTVFLSNVSSNIKK